ncbi:uncharacterized protein LOC134530114 [Bacillus rossius redtenbacheri]|uniref:uncharacterized protein LOC134530114 n=1 Tax=Bacillus rossius redtenbacheri TaxID=93214 RepID=UPI002FDE3522
MSDNTAVEMMEPDTEEVANKENSKECEYYQTVLRPMMSGGHEGELCEWLKQMGLLRRSAQCSNPDCKGRSPMCWRKARIVDKYNWACPDCTRKVSIREGSFFLSIKCEMKAIIRCMLGWCERTSIDVTSSQLDLKQHVVRRVYERCTDVAQAYVLSRPQDWLLGGDGAVVVVDVFPDGYMSERRGTGRDKRVLCIADTGHVPARIWAALLEHAGQQVGAQPGTVDEVLGHVRSHVRPGSTLVVSERSRACPHEMLQGIPDYPSTISVETLMGLDLPGTRRIQENLETIWHSAVEVCEEIQEMPTRSGASLLNEYMWRQLFAVTPSSAMQSLLHHIADQFPLQD